MSPVDRDSHLGDRGRRGFVVEWGLPGGVVIGLTGAREIGNKKAARRRLS